MTKKIHFSGIGGTAMVAGARLALESGWEVRGSDTPLYPPASAMVQALGVPVAVGYAAAHLDWDPDIVILGNVLGRGNPEVEAALSRHMNYMSLPEWLKHNVLRMRRPVVVAGTHGKTTTTALLAWILDRGGLAPGFLVGGEALGFPHSSRLGAPGAPFVIEGDEYDTAFFDKRAKFLHYLPDLAIVTSVEFDHGDIYADLAEIETAFQRMLRQIPGEGRLFLCADNHAHTLAPHAFCPVETYGFHPEAHWRCETKEQEGVSCLEISRHNVAWGTVRPALSGNHNSQNTTAAVAVAATLGMAAPAIAEAVASFPGVRRRMEVFLETDQLIFVDDFAHHPTAIRETIAAARTQWPKRRLRVIFEPRSNTTVTNRFQKELGESFLQADDVSLGPIHRAEAIAPAHRLNKGTLVGTLRQNGISAHDFETVEAIMAMVVESACPGDLFLIMSNGAFGGIYEKLRAQYAEKA